MKVFLAGIKRRPILTLIIVLAALVLGISLPGAVAAMTTLPEAPIRALLDIGGSGTAGQVAFFTSGTDIGSDPNLSWDNTNKRLGIGTATPSRLLHVKGNIALFERNVNSAGFIIERNGADVVGYNRWVFGVDEPTGFVIKTYPYDGATAVEQLVITKDNPSTPANESQVLIGTTSPGVSSKLFVQNDGGDAIRATSSSNTNGANSAMFGESNGDYGIGVYGDNHTYGNRGSLGTKTAGVYGDSTQGGVGVQGHEYSTGNNGYLGTVNEGVKGVGGTGVRGENSATGNYGFLGSPFYGVYGSGGDSGVNGYNAGGGYGVSGYSSSGKGVYGQNNGSANYGYLGSPGYGVYGYNNSNGNYGYLGDSNYGAYGYNSSGSYGYLGGSSYGVYGYSNSSVGVFGNTIGGNGVSGSSAIGYGVYGSSGTATGIFGSGGTYDFYAGGAGTNYGPFTGSHKVKLAADFAKNIKPGLIVSVTGETQVRNEKGAITYSSTLPTVQLAGIANEKRVFGVLIAESPLPKDHWYQGKGGERFGIVNALGEGRVWVTNLNGNIEAGDYITTSGIAGYGQKQADDILHSYTLGKATENVDWSEVAETIESDAKIYKAYPIAVVYTSG